MAIAIISAATALRILFLFASPLELSGDEAQYWAWAQHLGAGYYSKPPLIAWVIAASTALLGHSEWAVRLPAALFHAGTAVILFRLGTELWNEWRGFIASLLWITAPGVWFSAVIMSTDAPLLFFAAAALLSYLGVRRGKPFNYAIALGAAVGFGFLTKLAMVYAVLGVVLHCLFDPPDRDRRIPLAAAAGLALLLDLPSLVWNFAHDGHNFRTILESAALDESPAVHAGSALEFIIAQFGLLGPIAMAVLLIACFRPASWRDSAISLLLFFSVPVLALMLAESLASRAFANWAAMAYLPGALIVANGLAEHKRWLTATVGLNVLAGLALYAFGLGLFNLPLAKDPRGQLEGWRRLAPEVGRNWAASGLPVLITIDRNDMAKLLFYMTLRPGEIRMLSPDGRVHNSFDILAPLDAEAGAHALLFSRWPELGTSAALFEKSEIRAALTQSRRHGPLLKAYLFEVADFQPPG